MCESTGSVRTRTCVVWEPYVCVCGCVCLCVCGWLESGERNASRSASERQHAQSSGATCMRGGEEKARRGQVARRVQGLQGECKERKVEESAKG